MSLRVRYFGCYDRGAGRNAILIEGLRAAGLRVDECHAPLWVDTRAKLAAAGGGRAAAAALLRQARAWANLVGRWRTMPPCDVVLVGATAHLDLPLARVLVRGRMPLVFDPLVSIGETLRDRGLADRHPRRGALLARLERRLFRLPDLCLVDTRAHAEAWRAELGLDPARTLVVPAGAPSVYRHALPPYRPRAEGPLRVLYFGQFIPLHGLEVVLEAAARLADRSDIAFQLVGTGQMLEATRARAAALGLERVRFDPRWLPAEALAAEHIAGADLCLGIFGAQPKAGLVVPFKVYTALAAGRPVLSADTPALRELLRPGEEVAAVPPADPAALAAAIRRLAADPAERERLARAGQAAWDARFAPGVLGGELGGVLMRMDRGCVERGNPG